MRDINVKQIGFMKNFCCMAESCPANCCSGWKINVDDDTQKMWEVKAPELLEMTQKNESSECVMKKGGTTNNCVALKGNCCTIFKDYGYEYQPIICHYYPREYKKVGDDIFTVSNLSCYKTCEVALFAGKDDFYFSDAFHNRIPEVSFDYIKDRNIEVSGGEFLKAYENFMRELVNFEGTADNLLARVMLVAKMLNEIDRERWPKMMGSLFGMANDKTIESYLQSDGGAHYKSLVDRIMFIILKMEHSRHMSKHFKVVISNLIEKFGDIGDGGFNKFRNKWKNVGMWKCDGILQNYIKARLSNKIFPVASWSFDLVEEMLKISFNYIIFRFLLQNIFDEDAKLADRHNLLMTAQGIERIFYCSGQDYSVELCGEVGLFQLDDMMRAILNV